MNLHDVHRGIQRNKRRRRPGRGPGSGLGKTAGRGHKGAKARAGYSRHPTFQGGTMPLIRRIPKRGFHNQWGKIVAVVNVAELEAKFTAGEQVTPESLREKDLAKGRFDLLKVLGDGKLTKKLSVSAHRFSKMAREKIEQAGGKAILLVVQAPPQLEEKMKTARKSRA
jgi:large subunit ribosomal protein L15